MMPSTRDTDHGKLLHRPSRSGPAFWGPGDSYHFLITGAESGGAYFAMEAVVPPGGGPLAHIHRNEAETFYVLEGEIEFQIDGRTVRAGAGTLVAAPRGPCTPSRSRSARGRGS
jgi:quercetin dioxygenase-like cupin family protein